MTLIPMKKQCPECKKYYKFNPDVGVGIVCPHCYGTGMQGALKAQKKDEEKKGKVW